MHKLSGILVVTMLAILAPLMAMAEADGPDYYRVIGVGADDVLNIRAEPDASSKKIGAIPANADGIRNLGCQGGLSYSDWVNATEAEREAAKRTRWCRISYDGVEGWVAGWFLAEGSAPRNGAATPSFDCTKAASTVEKAICANPQLASLDRELSRLYRLAADGPNMSSERSGDLKETQRRWLREREACATSDNGLNACVVASFAARIDELRTGYFDARQKDSEGISTGPFAYDCPGLNAALSMVIIASDPAIVSLGWRDNLLAAQSVADESGARFQARTPEGTYAFRAKGKSATFSLADGRELACTLDLSD